MQKDDDQSDLDSDASWLNVDASNDISSWTHGRELREKNKSLRRIFEEANLGYGRDVKSADASGREDMRKRTKIALELRHKQVKEIVQKMSEARNLDLCFLVDVTGSMHSHIQGVKNHIRAIVDRLTKVGQTKTIGTASMVKKLRIAFVGYRDFNDSPSEGPQFEVLDFTDSVDAFHKFCGSIVAKGGGFDSRGAEDVFGGLEKANGLNWRTDGSTRMLFHIADMPCHGKEFHEGVSDYYPYGDPLGRSHHLLLGQLADREIFYHFGKITNNTNTMIGKFVTAYDGEFIVCELKEADKIFENVISTTSIAVTRVGPGPSRRIKKSEFDTVLPNWGALPVLQCLLLSYELPDSLNEVFLGMPLKQKQPLKANIQIAGKPFAAGAERMAFYGQDVTNRSSPTSIVLKKYTAMDGKVTLKTSICYEAAIQMQTIAAYLASIFTAELLAKARVGYAITFLKTQLLSHVDTVSGQRVFMSCEKSYPAGFQYLRFTNNMDYAMLEQTAKLKGINMAFVEQLFAFSHWTHQVSGGRLMVVDLQGIISTGSDGHPCSIELTDPAIHCTDLTRFGGTNLGLEGMQAFFNSHKCNDICAKMGLVVPEQFRKMAG